MEEAERVVAIDRNNGERGKLLQGLKLENEGGGRSGKLEGICEGFFGGTIVDGEGTNQAPQPIHPFHIHSAAVDQLV